MEGKSIWGLFKVYYGMFSRRLWEYARFIMGCLGEGRKTGKGKDQSGLERNKCGITEGKRG